MKTASKPLRVPADIDESSPTPVRVLRNGKKIRATPRLPKASRVTLSPEDTKAFGGAHRVPFAQVPSWQKLPYLMRQLVLLQHAHTRLSRPQVTIKGYLPHACDNSMAIACQERHQYGAVFAPKRSEKSAHSTHSGEYASRSRSREDFSCPSR